jgi:hypothetical protein
MGFDVRGVVFGPWLDNSDGLTIVMSPEFFKQKNIGFGYQDGMLGVPDSVADYTGLAGYKYFADGLWKTDDLYTFFANPENMANRGKFGPKPQKNSRHYILDWTGTAYGFMTFNYAIYANYNWPTGTAPYDVEDFPITTANSQEAFCAKATETYNSLWAVTGSTSGGALALDIEVFDWQGNINAVSLQCLRPGVLAPKSPDAYLGPGTIPHSYKYRYNAMSLVPVSSGDLDFLITATDSLTFGQAWFASMLPSYNPKTFDKVYNCFVYTAQVLECPKPVVTSIVPNSTWGQIDDAVITGANFVNGPSLAVKLTRLGQPDTIATDVKFVSSTKITCDIMSGGLPGLWNVVVTNGCPLNGQLDNGFETFGCTTAQTCPTSGSYVVISTNNSSYNYEPTRAAATPRIIGPYSAGTYITARTYNVNTWYFQTTLSYTVYNIAITSKDRIYYYDSGSVNSVWYMDYSEASGFLNIRTLFGTITSGWTIMRLAVDENDNPIVLARGAAATQLRVFHWDGVSAWKTIDVPAALVTAIGNTYSYVQDFDYDPSTSYYFITDNYGIGSIYAFTATGIQWKDEAIWPAVSGTSYWPNLFIDKLNPKCHLIVNAGVLSYPTNTTYFARYNQFGGQKTTSACTVGSPYLPARLGCMLRVGSATYWCGLTGGTNVAGYISVANWP